jgi:hypothetical protein
MRVFLCVLGAVAVSSALAVPARADDPSTLTEKLGTAAAGVKSFVVEMRVTGTTGVNGTLTFVRPLNIKSDFSMGQMQIETYMVDGMVYMRAPAGGWQKMRIDAAASPALSANIADSLKASKVTVLPDRQEDGATVGVIAVDAKLPVVAGTLGQSGPQQIVCSYDKTSYLIRVCTSSLMTMTYTKYNDPANTVVLPPGAKDAVPMVLPSPASSAAGMPAGSTSLPTPAAPPPTMAPAAPGPSTPAPSTAPIPTASPPT